MREKTGNGDPVNLERFLADLKTVVRDGQALLKASVHTVKERAVARARLTEERVHEHPLRSMGIVFGLGVLVGAVTAGLFARRED